MPRPALRGLYGITPQALLDDDEQLLQAVRKALQGGMSWLQYRAKRQSPSQRLRQAEALRRLCNEFGAGLIINDDIDLAQGSGADGVHLGADDAAIDQARNRLGDKAVIGLSCYNSLSRAETAAREGADYLAFGRFFPSRTKPDAVPASLDLLDRARQRLTTPLCAIGGITPQNAIPLVDRGADLLAVVEGLFAASDIGQQAARFTALFDSPRASRPHGPGLE